MRDHDQRILRSYRVLWGKSDAHDTHAQILQEVSLARGQPPHTLKDATRDLIAHVALKLVKATSPDDDVDAVAEALAKTAREMEHHQRVADSSEFIVSLLTWGQIGDEYFFVSMELCAGGDVAKLLEARQY